jgi:hypothetical protein
MLFLRKLIGGRKQPQKPSSVRSASPASPPRPLAEVSPSASNSPTLADLSPAPRNSYFEYVGGGSSKFYAVSLEEEEGGTWRVRFNFGRIGFPRAWDTRVSGVPWTKAATAYAALVEEKLGKGYEIRQWPGNLKLPDGTTFDEDASAARAVRDDDLFRASKRGTLPPEKGGSIAGVALPDGILYAPMPEGGSRGEDPVVWASAGPVANVHQIWSRLAGEFAETAIWPFVVSATHGFEGFGDYLMDVPRGRHSEALAILRKGWNEIIGFDEDYPDDEIAPFGKQFPGLAAATPGQRARSIDHIVASVKGHLGLVALNRPADILDAVGWTGAVNYDGDPLNMSTVLRSWEVRFDAYVVGLGTDTLTLAVGRPARDLAPATAIAAEHFAFCPDIIQQGAGSIHEYAPLLVNQELWPFWWD